MWSTDGPSQELRKQLVDTLGLVHLHPVARLRQSLQADLRRPRFEAAQEARPQVAVALAPDHQRRHVDYARFDMRAEAGPIVIHRRGQRAGTTPRGLVER